MQVFDGLFCSKIILERDALHVLQVLNQCGQADDLMRVLPQLRPDTVIGYRPRHHIIIMYGFIRGIVTIGKDKLCPIFRIFFKLQYFQLARGQQPLVKLIRLYDWRSPDKCNTRRSQFKCLLETWCQIKASTEIFIWSRLGQVYNIKRRICSMKLFHPKRPPILLHNTEMSSTISLNDCVWAYP